MELPDLVIDNMSVDTSKAINYFELNKYKFKCQGEINAAGLIIKRKGLEYMVYPTYVNDTPAPSSEDYNQRLRSLAKEVESNAGLFSQLEHLTRNYPVEQVLNCDIKLIVQNLLYWSDASEEYKLSICPVLLRMGSGTNLAALGMVAVNLIHHEHACIDSTEDTVVQCHLFAELCRKVGLDVGLEFSDELEEENFHPGHCVGVITENADVDSAVDVLLESSTKCPWKLARILVQECVYNTFKRAVQWKTSLQPPSTVTVAEDHKSKCTDVYAYKGKVLYIDYAGCHSDGNIAVEAYRTTKELLSLVANGPHSFMSLWSNSLSESNEIAYSEWSPRTIWINNFGVFDGPAKSSQPFYEPQYYEKELYKVNKSVIERQKQWSRLTFDQRRNLIITTLNNVKDNENIRLVAARIQNWKRDDVFYVDNGKMCVCITKPHELAYYTVEDFGNILRALMIGTAIVVERPFSKNHDMNALVPALEHVGAPLHFEKEDEEEENNDGQVFLGAALNCGYTKVVWSNFGTIFAN